jgi:hypothetical protein
MAVADQIGIPVANVGEAVATGTMSGFDESSMEQNERPEEDRNGES